LHRTKKGEIIKYSSKIKKMRKTKTTNYIRGRNFEYKVKKLLEEEGNIVLRTAGSHGLFDLIGIKFYRDYVIVGFWQLKKNITDRQAKKYLHEICIKLKGDTRGFSFSQPIRLNQKGKIKQINCFIGDTGLVIFWGIIYTPTKRKTKNGQS